MVGPQIPGYRLQSGLMRDPLRVQVDINGGVKNLQVFIKGGGVLKAIADWNDVGHVRKRMA
jgi:hypothetical protein